MKFTYLLLFVFLFSSCKNMVKAPDFKGIKNIDIKQKENGKSVLVANAAFTNPNLVGGKFKIDNIEVFIDNKAVGKLNSEEYKVPAKKDFVVPLEIDFDKDFLKNNKGNLWDMLGKLANNSLKVKYVGKIRYVSHGLNIPYSIDYEEEIKIFK